MGFADALKAILTRSRLGEAFFENLEDALIESDIGAETAFAAVEEIRDFAKKHPTFSEKEVKDNLKKMLRAKLKAFSFPNQSPGPLLLMFLGVNGVGKTTTLAKLAYRFKTEKGAIVILAAADTFRAAAIDQLKIHGERLGVRVIAQAHGSDPGAVVYDAIDAALAANADYLLVDTAGRLHNKQNLVRELEKITKIATAKLSNERILKFLVLDSTTGRNGLRQAETFHEAVGIDALILTKMDSTAKGGVVFAAAEIGLTPAFITDGEDYCAIQPFDPESFVEAFVG
jgi:fused signal recognition particle receptor